MTKDLGQKIVLNKGCLLVGGILLLFGLYSNGQGQAEPVPVEDIRDIMLDRPPASIVPVLVSLVILVGALMFGFFALRNFLRRPPETKGPPPEMIARHKLSEIRGEVDDVPPNKASLDTSETVKDFLTAQYGDPIRYETAEEYLNRMIEVMKDGASKLSPGLTEEVRTFMSISQELKFAQLKEARSRIPALIDKAEKIVTMAVEERLPAKRK